ncbi:MAG: hypothetical protein ACUVWP_05620 [bacterium]
MKRINILVIIGLFLLSALTVLAKGPIETEPAYTLGAGHFDLDGSFDLKWQTEGADEEKYVLLVFNAEPTIGILPMMDLRGRIPIGYYLPKVGDGGFGLGDMGIGAKVAFLREPNMPLTMSVFTMVTLPNGKASYHMSNNMTDVAITGCISKTLIHIIMLHANIGTGFSKPEAVEGEEEVGWQAGDLKMSSALVIGFPWTLALFGEVVTKKPLSGDNREWISYSNTGLVFSPIPLLRFNFSFLYDLKDSPDMKWGIRAGMTLGF